MFSHLGCPRRSPTKLLIVAYTAAHTPAGHTGLRRDCASSGRGIEPNRRHHARAGERQLSVDRPR